MAIFPTTSLGNLPTFETPEQKKQKMLLIIFVVLLLIIAGIIYYGFFYQEKSSVPIQQSTYQPAGGPLPEVTSEAGSEIAKNKIDVGSLLGYRPSEEFSFVESAKIDFGFFKEKKFEELKEFSSSLDISQEKGRHNPFSPY